MEKQAVARLPYLFIPGSFCKRGMEVWKSKLWRDFEVWKASRKEAMTMVKGRTEVTVKFSETPQANLLGDKVIVSLECDDRVITATVKAKTWKKAIALMLEYPLWVASLTGKLGSYTRQGFSLVDAGMQVFEKKPKELLPEEAKP